MAKKNDSTTLAPQAIEAVSPTSDFRIVFVERENSPERLVCEAELVFGSGRLRGRMKLVGFSPWKSPGGELYVTVPSRDFGSGLERRFFDFLRSVEGAAAAAKAVKQAIAYRERATVGKSARSRGEPAAGSPGASGRRGRLCSGSWDPCSALDKLLTAPRIARTLSSDQSRSPSS